jgi:hypothetical protein
MIAHSAQATLPSLVGRTSVFDQLDPVILARA